MSIWKDYRRDAEDGFEAFMLIVINGAILVVPMAIAVACVVFTVKGCDNPQKTEQQVQNVSIRQQPDAKLKNTLVLSQTQLNNYIKSR